MKVPPQFWCSPSKNHLSQTVAAQTWGRRKKKAAFRWGHAFLTVYSLRHFHVASFPSAAQRHQKLWATAEDAQTQPETATEQPWPGWESEAQQPGEVCALGDLAELGFVTQEAWLPQPRASCRKSCLSPALKTAFSFSSKGFMALWASPLPSCDPQHQQQDVLTGQGQEQQPPPCTSGPAHLCREGWQRTLEVWAVSFCLRSGRGYWEQHKCRKTHWKKVTKPFFPLLLIVSCLGSPDTLPRKG